MTKVTHINIYIHACIHLCGWMSVHPRTHLLIFLQVLAHAAIRPKLRAHRTDFLQQRLARASITTWRGRASSGPEALSTQGSAVPLPSRVYRVAQQPPWKLMMQQDHGLPPGWQGGNHAGRRFHFVADALNVDHHMGWINFQQRSRKPRNHPLCAAGGPAPLQSHCCRFAMRDSVSCVLW